MNISTYHKLFSANRQRRSSRKRKLLHSKCHSCTRSSSNYIFVEVGDDLKSLAQKAYANSSLWYVLAAANALSGDSDLVAGTSLKVPDTGVAKNDSSTFKPYNPNEIIGSTAPSLPYIPPASSNQCAVVAVVIVAIVVIALTYGQAAPYLSSMLTPIATLATTTGITTVGAIAGGFVAGVAGSIASQVVGKALGVVDHFSLRTAVANGFATAITMGVGAATTAMGTVGDMIRAGQWGRAAAVAVVNSSSSYVGNKLAGVKDNSFSWKSIAASAVSTMVSASISNKLNFNSQKPLFGSGDYAQDVMNDSIGGVVSLHTRRAFGFDDKADYGSILANAFGTATGNGLVRAMQGGSFLGRVQKSPEASEQRQIYDAVGPDTNAEQVGKTAADYVNFGSPVSSTTSASSATSTNTATVAASPTATGFSRLDKIAMINNFYESGEKLSIFARKKIVDAEWKSLFGEKYQGKVDFVDSVSVSASGYNGAAGNNLSRGTGYGVYRPNIIAAFQARGGTPHLARPSQRNTGYPGGMSAGQYRQDSNRQLWSDFKGIFTPIPALANIKEGLQDFAVDVGTSNIPGAYATGALMSVGAEFLPQSPVDVALTLLGGKAIIGEKAASIAFEDSLPKITSLNKFDGKAYEISAKRVIDNGTKDVVVIGRGMDAVRAYARALESKGLNVQLFDTTYGTMSKDASREYSKLMDLYGAKIPDEQYVLTKVFRENVDWAGSAKSLNKTIIDIGNPYNVPGSSKAYNTETGIFFDKW